MIFIIKFKNHHRLYLLKQSKYYQHLIIILITVFIVKKPIPFLIQLMTLKLLNYWIMKAQYFYQLKSIEFSFINQNINILH